jgi:ABC-2 type transport system ATP-binding protein
MGSTVEGNIPQMIEITRLQKNIDGVTVLDLEALRVRTGQIVGLVGPAGSGIDELFEILIGRARPTAGTVLLGGEDLDGSSSSLGVLFADDGLYTRRTARSNLRFFARLYGLETDRVEDVLSNVGLGDQGSSMVEDLSGGLARRLAFGRAILHQPRILILREPFARCDQSSISLLQRLIREQAEGGAAVLILGDDDANLPGLCHQIHRIQRGQVVETSESTADAGPESPLKIPVKNEGSVALVNPSDVLFATAEEGKATIQTVHDEALSTQFTLSELEARLVQRGFFRAHRSYLVNLQHVTEVIPFTRDSYSLRLDDAQGTLIPLSKTAAGELRELLGY